MRARSRRKGANNRVDQISPYPEMTSRMEYVDERMRRTVCSMPAMSRQSLSSCSQYLAHASLETRVRASSTCRLFSASMAEGKYPSGLSARVTKPSNASVTPRQADSTTASRGLGDASTMSATRRKHPASATLDPPNLCTIQLSMLHARPFSLGVLVAPKLYKLMNCGAKPLDSPEL